MEHETQSQTWLELLQKTINLDIDCMDPDEAKRLLPFKPYDQTSNQRLVYERMISPANREMFHATVQGYNDQGWEAILTRMSALLCAKNTENILGRVLVQTSAFATYDTEKVIAQARAYAQEFASVGISKDRFCIKIPCTGPALNAGQVLLKEGIRTLGTSLFSVEQAIAASQAGCLSISPYYNFPWYHADAKLWPDVEDPVLQHPMTPRIMRIIQVYEKLYNDTGKEQPLMKPASFKSAKEVMAMAELGCQHATVPEDILLQLSLLDAASSPPPGYGNKTDRSAKLAEMATTDPLTGQDFPATSVYDVDYLKNNGEVLTAAIAEDPITSRGLFEALEAFKENELQSKAAIEEAIREIEAAGSSTV